MTTPKEFWYGFILSAVPICLFGAIFGMTFSALSGLLIVVIFLQLLFIVHLRITCRRLKKHCQDEMVRAYQAECAVEANRKLIDQLLSDVTELQTLLSQQRTKDAVIEALQRRVRNISAEYNDKYFNKRSVTLADVYRLTGEQ